MKNRRSNKNSKIKSFLFFLLLAILFWGLTKLSREYTAATNAKIEYIRVPDGIAVEDDNPKSISFDMTASGFEFLMYNISDHKLKIDVASLYREGDTEILIPKDELLQMLTALLKKNSAVANIYKKELRIGLSEIVSIKVPIIAQTNIQFKEGFGALDSLRIKPDSIVISGPHSLLTTIHAIKTNLFSKDAVDVDISSLVLLSEPENAKIRLLTNEVLMELEVTEFSQMQLLVPVEIINMPSDLTIKIIPEKIRITFIVSVDEFNSIRANDFKIICDYTKRNTSENFMTPTLVNKPKRVQKVEFLDKNIDFLIFK